MNWMRKRDRSLLSNATSLLICGVLAGVVVAAAAFPAVAMSGLAAKAGADQFDSLPSSLTVQQSPQITYVYASDGKTLLSTFYDENRRDVPINDVSMFMREAMVSSEDTRFYEHHGVDVKGVARAFVANQEAGGTSQGASTLTMQYVRQAIEYSATTPQEVVDATSDTPGRKIREMRYALAIEKQLTKQQILERYMNIAPFGNGAFGIYAASQVYFGKSPKDLTLGESALLAGLVQAPTDYNPATADGLAKATERRNNYVLVNMVKMGYITEAERQQAIATPLKVSGKQAPNGCTAVTNNSWGFFCDYLYRWWLQQPAFGSTPYERENRLKSGGYTIVTSLDVNAQNAAVKNINAKVKTSNKVSDALMLAGVEPATGHIELMAVNRNYSNDQSGNGPSTNPDRHGQKGNYPNTTNPLISGGGDIVGYQFGSTFKMFTMLTALSQGMPLASSFNAPYQYVSDYMIDPSSPASCNNGHYCPTNAAKNEAGVFNMWSGFGASVNTYFVHLEQQVGADKVVQMAEKLGVQFRAPADANLAKDASQWGAFTLGVSAATPLDMANAYATVAADGNYCEPLPVLSIKDFNGSSLDAANPRCNQVIDPNVARAAVDAARCPVGDQSAYGECKGNETAPGTKGIVGKPVAGKTGTTDSNATAALITMTKQLAVAGVIADPDNSGHRGYSHDEVNYAVATTLRDAMKDKQSINFTKPNDKLAYGSKANIPGVKCQSPDAAKATLRNAGFDTTIDPTPVASDCPAGTVAKTSPSGSTTASSVITLYLSAGAGGGGSSPGNNGGGGGGNNGGGGGGGAAVQPTCFLFCRN